MNCHLTNKCEMNCTLPIKVKWIATLLIDVKWIATSPTSVKWIATLSLTNLRPSALQVPKNGTWDPFLKKVPKHIPFCRLDIPPFSTKQHFLFIIEKSVSDRTKPLLVCKFSKFWQNKKCKKVKSPLNIHVVAVWKNKNEILLKFNVSMSNNLTYNLTQNYYDLTRCQIIWHIIWHTLADNYIWIKASTQAVWWY